jgi:hypothetical protein
VFFDSDQKGITSNGTLLVQVYTMGSPYHNLTMEKEGYRIFTAPVTRYPGKGEPFDLSVTLIPATVVDPGIITR